MHVYCIVLYIMCIATVHPVSDQDQDPLKLHLSPGLFEEPRPKSVTRQRHPGATLAATTAAFEFFFFSDQELNLVTDLLSSHIIHPRTVAVWEAAMCLL